MNRIAALYRRVIRKIDRVWTKKRVEVLWPVVTRIPGWRGVQKRNGETVIVSLTSFPARIGTVDETVKSLLLQKKKPDTVVLWLAKTQFPQGEKELPQQLLKLQAFGLKIDWCGDIRSYKKLIPTLEQYPEAIIVTADDDVYYRKNWLKMLYEMHLAYPESICAHRVTKFYLQDEQYKVVRGGEDIWPGQPTILHVATGCGGVLYPPHTLYKDTTNPQLFMELCPTNDDIWFWLMAVLNGTKVCAPQSKKKRHIELIYVPGTQEGPTLCSINNEGEKLFWKDFHRALAHYPELDGILKREYERLTAEEPFS